MRRALGAGAGDVVNDLFSTVAEPVRTMLGAGAPEVWHATDEFSDCGHFRFTLEYRWGAASVPPMIFVGQNPSRASHQRTDATVIRCARRAYRADLGGLVVLNLFPRVATLPKDLWAAGEDPVEEARNIITIRRTVEANPGAVALFAPGGDDHPRHRAQAAKVEALLRRLGLSLFCLGTTNAGLPRHPSRLGYDVAMQPWTGSFGATSQSENGAMPNG